MWYKKKYASTPTSTTTTLKNHLKKHSSAHQEHLRLISLKENIIKEKWKKTNKVFKNSEELIKLLFKSTSLDPSNKRTKK